jgi:hypothetical protein
LWKKWFLRLDTIVVIGEGWFGLGGGVSGECCMVCEAQYGGGVLVCVKPIALNCAKVAVVRTIDDDVFNIN